MGSGGPRVIEVAVGWGEATRLGRRARASGRRVFVTRLGLGFFASAMELGMNGFQSEAGVLH
jgi:hypothetical protein